MPHIRFAVRPIARCALTFAFMLMATRARAGDSPTFADRPDEDVRDADRKFAFLLNPLAMAIGVFGGEVDFVLGRHAALAFDGDLYRRGDATGEAIGGGLLLYPLGNALHGLYFEPRVTYARPSSEPVVRLDWSLDVVGLGAAAGWQWTWDYGLSVRVGGGAMNFFGGPRSGASSELLAIGPEVVLDGSLGWAF